MRRFFSYFSGQKDSDDLDVDPPVRQTSSSKPSKNEENEIAIAREEEEKFVKHVVHHLSFDVIVYRIISMLWFELKVFHDHSLHEFYGVFSTDPNRGIYLIFSAFIMKLSNQLKLIPSRYLTSLRVWKFYVGFPAPFLKNLKKIQSLKGFTLRDLVLTKKMIQEISGSIENLSCSVERIPENNELMKVFCECKKLTVLTISMRGGYYQQSETSKSDYLYHFTKSNPEEKEKVQSFPESLSSLEIFSDFSLIRNHFKSKRLKVSFSRAFNLKRISLCAMSITRAQLHEISLLNYVKTVNFKDSFLKEGGLELLFSIESIQSIELDLVCVDITTVAIDVDYSELQQLRELILKNVFVYAYEDETGKFNSLHFGRLLKNIRDAQSLKKLTLVNERGFYQMFKAYEVIKMDFDMFTNHVISKLPKDVVIWKSV